MIFTPAMRIADIPHFNRPNIRMKHQGPKSLSDAELLAIILGRGTKTENAVDFSHRILNTYNLFWLSKLDLEELNQFLEDDVKSMKLIAMFELFKRTNKLNKSGYKTKITSAQDVYNRFVDELISEKQEHFIAIYLDTKNQIISQQLISKGTLNASLIHPREVFKPGIKASANTLILIHNHPSGDPTPSNEDEVVTKNIAEAGELLGITVLDHIIIGKDSYISLKEKGIF